MVPNKQKPIDIRTFESFLLMILRPFRSILADLVDKFVRKPEPVPWAKAVQFKK